MEPIIPPTSSFSLLFLASTRASLNALFHASMVVQFTHILWIESLVSSTSLESSPRFRARSPITGCSRAHLFSFFVSNFSCVSPSFSLSRKRKKLATGFDPLLFQIYSSELTQLRNKPTGPRRPAFYLCQWLLSSKKISTLVFCIRLAWEFLPM